MLTKDIAKILGYYLLGLTLLLLLPLTIAAYYEFHSDPISHPQPHTTIEFLVTAFLSFFLACICLLYGKGSSGHLFRREGLISVVIIWFLTPAIAAFPFYMSGTLSSPLQAYFEATSGFTTTGATVMYPKQFDAETGAEIPIVKTIPGTQDTNYIFYGTIDPVRDPQTGEILHEGIEAVSKALLFWRSFTQWMGGMGIIVLFVAILPALGVGGKMLFQAEVPGPVKDSLTPRIKETALHLWKIYLGLSIIEVVLLHVTNSDIGWMDSITITFSNISTGGFTVKNASIGHWGNRTTEWIVILFMFLGSINFSIYFHSLRGRFYRVYEPEFFLYLFLLLGSCLLTTFVIVGTTRMVDHVAAGPFNWEEAIRYGFFQVISTHTGTGFTTTDYEYWPYAAQALMLITMFLGGMAGSTTGGMKIVRHYMLFRIAQFKIESLFRPETVRRFKVGNRDVNKDSALMVLSFFLIVMVTSVASTFVFICSGMDPETALSMATLTINNIGIGFRMASPIESCAFLSSFDLAFSSLLMVLGRIEFLAVLAVFVPAFWRQNS